MIAVRSKETMQQMPFTKHGFVKYDAEELSLLLEKNGFNILKTIQKKEPPFTFNDQVMEFENIIISCTKGLVDIPFYFLIPHSWARTFFLAPSLYMQLKYFKARAMDLQDVIIIGGGPAGLNAAVVLGRCQRKVLLFDTKQYRNRWSHGMHNYLTQDDIAPGDFIRLSHKELKKYGVNVLHKKIIHARKNEQAYFVVKDDSGGVYHAKKLLVATGLADNVPRGRRL